MVFSCKSALGFFAVSLLATAVALPDPSKPINQGDYSPADIITRDVLVIGGGSSGTYSAIKLRDLGKSVAVVEAKAVLGGHTETWTDPVTQAKVDIGVIVFHDEDLVRKYFGRYQIPLTKLDFGPTVTKYYNFRTGKSIPGYTSPDPNFTAYAALLATKYPYLESGFDLPDPVPEDLLLSFGDFAKKYNLGGFVNFAASFAQGLGDLLKLPSIYVLKNISLAVLQNLQAGFLTTARHNNHELYEKALAELGHDALLSSTVVAIDRNHSGQYAKILVRTPSGKKLILAKNILISIPPLLENLKHFDLNDEERSLFAKFKYASYYTTVLRNNVIPPNLSLHALDPSQPYDIPNLPRIYSFDPTGYPGLTNVKYISNQPLPLERVKADILNNAKLLTATTAGNVNSNGSSNSNSTSANLEVTVLSAHSPFELRVDADAIRGGYYKKLYALQGKGRFWYTGAAFHTHDSSSLWEFSEKVVARIVLS